MVLSFLVIGLGVYKAWKERQKTLILFQLPKLTIPVPETNYSASNYLVLFAMIVDIDVLFIKIVINNLR